MKNREVLIWLNNLEGVSNRHLEYFDTKYSNLVEVWDMSAEEIEKLPFRSKKLKRSMSNIEFKNNYPNILLEAEKKGIQIITIRDKEHPDYLKEIPDPPRVLYIKGEIKKQDEIAIAIVGPRKPSSYGVWATQSICKEFSKLGITIISGMALGIDTIAHKVSMENDNRTIAVLGTGADIVYPSTNRGLYKEISKNGAIISEFAMGTKGYPYNFPQRNRIVSGLSQGIIVIEAKERSGTLITVSHGLEQGKDIFAVPGNINSEYSRGTNALIRDGAKIIQDVDDVIGEIEAFRDKTIDNKNREAHKSYEGLSEIEKSIIRLLERGIENTEEISRESGIEISKLLSILTVLEIKEKIIKIKGTFYIKRN